VEEFPAKVRARRAQKDLAFIRIGILLAQPSQLKLPHCFRQFESLLHPL
jgi:hypothetical protein